MTIVHHRLYVKLHKRTCRFGPSVQRFVENSSGCVIAERFAWSRVEFLGDGVEFGLAMVGEVWAAAVISDSGPPKVRDLLEMRSAVTATRRRFSPEFKDELCQEVISTSKTIKAVAVAYGVGPETLRNWLIKYRDAHGGTEAELTLTERARLKELERVVQDLRAETAFPNTHRTTSMSRCCDDRLNPPSIPRPTTASWSRLSGCVHRWAEPACALDNAIAESFFSALKNERVDRTVYATKAQARRDVIAYIEGLYNSHRRHSALGYKRPNEVHYSYQQPLAAA